MKTTTRCILWALPAILAALTAQASAETAFRPRVSLHQQPSQYRPKVLVSQDATAAVAPLSRTSLVTTTQQPRGGAVVSSSLLHTLKVGFYFGLWYLLNIFYNIFNKKLLNVMPAPLVIGSIQLLIGSVYVATLWLLKLRAAPTLSSPEAIAQFRNVGFWHALGQETTMVSLCAGAVSFTHIVKALEPFFSSVVSIVAFGERMPLPVYASLIPVVGGVGYACMKESAFSWLAFSSAMASNLAFALRAVLSKVAMGTAAKSGKNLTSPNVFAVVTIFGFLLSLPMAIIGEGSSIVGLWNKALQTMSQKQLIQAIIVSGLFHYLNNEVMYLALGNVHPVTLAVGNTMKRVFIMVASVMVFRNPISMQAGIGSAVGISGVLVYSLVKQHYDALAASAPKKKAVVAAKKAVVAKVKTAKVLATRRK